MSGYILSVDADLDLNDVWEYIAADNIDAADQWIEKRSSTPLKPSHKLLVWDTGSKT